MKFKYTFRTIKIKKSSDLSITVYENNKFIGILTGRQIFNLAIEKKQK